jgi:hypothetical protein
MTAFAAKNGSKWSLQMVVQAVATILSWPPRMAAFTTILGSKWSL